MTATTPAFTEFLAGRHELVMDKPWCDEFAEGRDSQRILDYGHGCFIYCLDDGRFELIIGNLDWVSGNLAELELKLFEAWYLPEILGGREAS